VLNGANYHRILFMPATRPLLLSCLLMLLSACGHLDSAPPSNQAATKSAWTPTAAGQSAKALCNSQWLLESLTVDGREHKPRMFWNKMWRDRPYLTCDKLGFVRSGDIRWLKVPKISRMGDRKESNELEQDFLLALPRVSSASPNGDTLILRSSDGNTQLEFKRTGELAPAAH
jgi:hypothetical protein